MAVLPIAEKQNDVKMADNIVADKRNEQVVYQRPQALTDVHTHYCPGCTHGVAHRLVAEVIDELNSPSQFQSPVAHNELPSTPSSYWPA